MGAYIDFAGFVFNMVVLAVVLGAVGFGVNRLINRIQASRTESKMKAEALVAAARARSRANARRTQALA